MSKINLWLIRILVIYSVSLVAQEKNTSENAFPNELMRLFQLEKHDSIRAQVKCRLLPKIDDSIDCPPEQNKVLSTEQVGVDAAQESLNKLAAEKIKQSIIEVFDFNYAKIFPTDEEITYWKNNKKEGNQYCQEKLMKIRLGEIDLNVSQLKNFLQTESRSEIISVMETLVSTEGYPAEVITIMKVNPEKFLVDDVALKLLPYLKEMAIKKARDRVEKSCLHFFYPDLWYDNLLQSKLEVAPNCHISKNEIAAILFYTGSGYYFINEALRSGKSSEWDNVISLLNSALMKLEPYDGFVKRGTNLPAEIEGKYLEASEVTELSYTSTSISEGFGGSHRFAIKTNGKNCFYLGKLSNSPGEEEVLCLPGTKFEILFRAQVDNVEDAKNICGEEYKKCIAIVMAEK